MEATETRFERSFRNHRRNIWARNAGGVLIVAVVFLWSADVSKFTLPRIVQALPRMGGFIGNTIPQLRLSSFFLDMAYWYYDFPNWLSLLTDTFLMAISATIVGGVLALLLSFLASRNITAHHWAAFVVRRAAEVTRTVPEVVFALVFVVAFGVGPTAGFLAITIHSFGALLKLYSELHEDIEIVQLEGLQAAGANWMQSMRFGVFPQVLPGIITYTLWRIELNIRSAAIIGFVGAGGIGQELYKAISLGFHEDISAIVVMIVITVMCIDIACEKLRHSIIGKENLI